MKRTIKAWVFRTVRPLFVKDVNPNRCPHCLSELPGLELLRELYGHLWHPEKTKP